jgi:hypothetical protein
MKVALRDSYVEYVLFAGVTEKYPPWFEEELYDTILLTTADTLSGYIIMNERWNIMKNS